MTGRFGLRGRTAALPVAAGVAVLVAAAGCDRGGGGAPSAGSAGTGTVGSGVVAQVGDARLTESDLKGLLPPELDEGLSGAEIREVVERWVRSELLYQQARRDQLEKTPEVSARIRDLEREMLADELLQRELAKRVSVTPDELQAYYKRHVAEYSQDLQLKQIVVNTREEAESILQLLRAGANFEQLARQRSVDPSGAQGGDLGFLGKDAMNPAFAPYVFGVQSGSIVGPIPSTYGFHVLRVAGLRPASDPISFDAARDEIMHGLLLEKQQAAQGALLDELRSRSRVQVASTYAGMSLVPAPQAPEQAPGAFVPRSAAARPQAQAPPAQVPAAPDTAGRAPK